MDDNLPPSRTPEVSAPSRRGMLVILTHRTAYRCALPSADPDLQTDEKIQDAFDHGWGVVVWNDPINTMDWVVAVFERVLGMTRPIATKHMKEVHHKGKSLVSMDTKEKAEFFVHRLQGFGLKATMEQV